MRRYRSNLLSFKKIFIKSEKYIENNFETGQAYSQNCWKQWIEVVNESYTNLRPPPFFFCQLLLYTLSLKQSQLRIIIFLACLLERLRVYFLWMEQACRGAKLANTFGQLCLY